MKNKKGLSGIVTTLIIILLGLVAAGVVWVVINNTVSKSAGNIEYGTACMDITIVPTGGSCEGTICRVIVDRHPGGEEIDGIQLKFYDKTREYGIPIPKNITFSSLGEKKPVENIDISNLEFIPKSVTVAAYFIKENGENYPCSESTAYEF